MSITPGIGPANGTRRPGWRGTVKDRLHTVRHRWQRGHDAGTLAALGGNDRARRLRLALLGALFLALTALFVYHLVYAPRRSALVAVAAPPYAWPFPPIAFGKEDLAKLAELDGQTLQLSDQSAAWTSAEQGLAALEAELQSLLERGAPGNLVIVYLSLHGGVDGQGRACLIPPGASPVRSESWAPVADVLHCFKALPDEWHKLLVFDSTRLPSHWPSGTLYNGFAESLSELFREAAIPNLAILNSTSPGQTGWSSPELGGSAFGHFFRLGLAGAADLKDEGGNANRQVTLAELERYLRKRVDAWTLHNRAAHQQPLLLTTGRGDLALATSLNRSSLARIMSDTPNAVEPPVKATSISTLWKRRDALLAANPVRYAPLEWREFEQKLLWLEDAAAAGDNYRGAAANLYSELRNSAQRAAQRAEDWTSGGGVFRQESVWTPTASQRPEKLVVHSLPLARFFGQLTPTQYDVARSGLARFLEMPTPEAALDLPVPPADDRGGGEFVEPGLARLLSFAADRSLWDQPQGVRQALEQQIAAEEIAAPADERLFGWLCVPIQPADAARRRAIDDLLIGDASSLAAAQTALAEAKLAYESNRRLSDQGALAYARRDAAWSELPYLALWLARPQPDAPSAQSASRQINSFLLPAFDSAQALDESLSVIPSRPAADASAPFARESAAVAEKVDALRKIFRDETARLMASNKQSASAWRKLDDALSTPLLSAAEREEIGRRRANLSARLFQEFESIQEQPPGAPSASNPTDAGLEASEPSYLEEIATRWDAHPCVALLRASGALDAPPAAAAERPRTEPIRAVAALGSEVRRALARVPGAVRKQADDYRDQSSSAGDPSTDEQSDAPAALSPTPTGPSLSSSSNTSTGAAPTGAAPTGAAPTGAAQFGAAPTPKPDAAVSSPSAPRLAAGPDSSPSTTAQAWSASRRSLVAADRIVRGSAALSSLPLPEDPTRLLRRCDWQWLLLWHSTRARQDFFGPPRSESGPLFVQSARGSLRGAESLGEMALATRERLAAERSALEQSIQAASDGLAPSAPDLLVANEVEDVQISVDLKSDSPTARALPTARGAIFLSDAQGRIAGTSRGVNLPLAHSAPGGPAGDDLEYTLTGPDLAGRGPILEATALVRGNRFASPFLLRPTGGIVIRSAPYRYGPPSVNLAGPSAKRASVVVILDCSQSMNEPAELEGPGGARRVTRMEVAKQALSNLLQQMAARGDARVGVKFYGHRVGWNTKKPEELLRQTDYANKIPTDLLPSEDVETILPLGRFDNAVLGRVTTPLKTIKPWGETPLYLAIIQSLADFEGDDANNERSIVVITDGANYQFNSPSPKSISDVLSALGDRKDIHIQIVGFGIPANQQAQAGREFDALATRTGGAYVTAQSPSSLLRSLEALLGPSDFSVFNPAGEQVGRAAVGSTVVIAPKPDKPTLFTVAFDRLTDRIELAGGEAVELAVARNQKELECPPYQAGDPVFGPLKGDSATDSGLLLGVHHPSWSGEAVGFPLSFQNQFRRFVPRPAEVWIEVSPVFPDRRAGTKYVFFDANFVPQKPAPLLDLSADQWPLVAKQAEVRAWVKSHPTPPDETIRLEELARQSVVSGELPNQPGIKYRAMYRNATNAGRAVVGVVVRHDADGPGLEALKVDFFPPASEIVRRYDAENRLATHLFYLDSTSASENPAAELRFTSRSAAHADASSLAAPIVVNVAPGSDVLRLTPASAAP